MSARLSTIVVRIESDAPPGEEVRIDGALIERAAWGTALPLDGGQHTVAAHAPDRTDWSTTVRLANEGDRATVSVPSLRSAPSAHEGHPPVRAALPAAAPSPRQPLPTWTPWRVGAAASAGVGLIAVGFGVGFGVQARSQWSERQANCAFNYCSDEGYRITAQARDSAMKSTVMFAIGGAGVAAGVALFVFAPRGTTGRVTVAGEAFPGGAAVRLRGTF